MAEVKVEAKQAPKVSGSCFLSKVAGLSFLKKDGSYVRFTPFWDMFKGDRIKVGYLQTDDQEVISRIKEDANCEVISQSEYDKAVKDLKKAPLPA